MEETPGPNGFTFSVGVPQHEVFMESPAIDVAVDGRLMDECPDLWLGLFSLSEILKSRYGWDSVTVLEIKCRGTFYHEDGQLLDV